MKRPWRIATVYVSCHFGERSSRTSFQYFPESDRRLYGQSQMLRRTSAETSHDGHERITLLETPRELQDSHFCKVPPMLASGKNKMRVSKRDTERHAPMHRGTDLAADRAKHEGVHDQTVAQTISNARAVFEPGGRRQGGRTDRSEVGHVDNEATSRPEPVGDCAANVDFDIVRKKMRVLRAQPGSVQALERRRGGRGKGVGRGSRLRVAPRLQPVPAEVGVGRGLVNRGQPRNPAGSGEQGEVAIERGPVSRRHGQSIRIDARVHGCSHRE